MISFSWQFEELLQNSLILCFSLDIIVIIMNLLALN